MRRNGPQWNAPSAGNTDSAGCESSRSRISVVPLRCTPQMNTGRRARARPRSMSRGAIGQGPAVSAAAQTQADHSSATMADAAAALLSSRQSSNC
jgi:hypothetical protein